MLLLRNIDDDNIREKIKLAMEIVIDDAIYRRNAPSWVSFLKSFPSRKLYIENIDLFIRFHIQQRSELGAFSAS